MKFISRIVKQKNTHGKITKPIEIWTVRQRDKYRITSAEMKFMRTAKYTWQDSTSSEDVLPEIKISSVVKKIQNYRNKWAQHVRRVDADRQTDCHT